MSYPSLIRENDWAWALSQLSALADLDATARQHKAFLRPRGVRSAADQLRLVLAYGVGLSLRQGSAWAESSAIAALSNPALLRRLSNSASWLEHLAKLLVEEAQVQPVGEWAGWRLRLVDATSLSAPGAVGTTWRLHVSYDLTGRVDGLELTDTQGTESLAHFVWRPGDVAIADRGYAKPGDLLRVVEAGAHVLVRLGWNALRLLDEGGEAFDLFATLAGVGTAPVVVPVLLDTRQKGQPYLPLRLVVARLPEEQAEKARKKVLANASRRCTPADPRSVAAAGYVMLLTSLPQERSPQAVLALYRLRWQVELLFKRFKSLLDLGELPAKNQELAKTWIFAKLVIALLAEKAARQAAAVSP